MNVYVEMAKRLAQEIEAAKLHLDRLHAALAAIEPLLTIEAKVDSARPRLSLSNATAVDVEPIKAADAGTTAEPSLPEADNETDQKQSSSPRKRVRSLSEAVGTETSATRPKRGRPRTASNSQESAESVATGAVEEAKEAAEEHTTTAKRKRQPKAPTSVHIPPTNKTFWLQTMGKRKQSVSEVVDRAIEKLGVNEEARPVLANRLSAWLYPAIKAGGLRAVGMKGKYKLYQVVQS